MPYVRNSEVCALAMLTVYCLVPAQVFSQELEHIVVCLRQQL